MDNSLPKISIENLVKIYGEKPHVALKMFREGKPRDFILQATGQVLGLADISVSINQGELFVVMGLSGSGKSTLVRCINRLIEPTSGHIYIDNEDITQVMQTDFPIVKQSTCLENILHFYQRGLPVAVVDAEEKFQGVVEASDVLASISSI